MRVTASEGDRIRRLAAARGLTASGWIRELIAATAAPPPGSGETVSGAPRWIQIGDAEYVTEGVHWLTPGEVSGATIMINFGG